MGNIETKVNEQELDKWIEKIPGCRIFLENFFLTCQHYPVEVNYLNYLRDLQLYSPTNKHIRRNYSALVEAFYEITGTNEGDLIDKA